MFLSNIGKCLNLLL